MNKKLIPKQKYIFVFFQTQKLNCAQIILDTFKNIPYTCTDS